MQSFRQYFFNNSVLPSDVDEMEPTKLRVKYKIGKVIGEGNFATVKECVEKSVLSL